MPLKLAFEIQYPDGKPLKRALVVYERAQDLSPAGSASPSFAKLYGAVFVAQWGV